MLIFKDIFLRNSGYISLIVWPQAIANFMVLDESELVLFEYSVISPCA